MYEELIERLREYPDREETAGGYVEVDWQDLLDAADAIESLTAQLTVLQAENTEKDREIERLTKRLQVSPYGDDKIDELEESCENLWFRAETAEQKLSRVEAERDALLEYANAQMECEMCKNDTFCPVANPMPENCALCELKPKCPCKWEWRVSAGGGGGWRRGK